jgi:5-methylthioadenosine/S-adenosylhomocysteine deaminase
VQAALLSGTTCVVENSYTGLSARFLAHSGLRAVVGLELFGVNQETAPEQWANWLRKLASVKEGADQSLKQALAEKRIMLAVAPHAPYTVCPALWQLADRWAQEKGSMVLAHVAESPEECQWFMHGNEVVDGHLQFAFGRIPSYKGDPVFLADQWRGQNHSPVAHLNEAKLLNERLLATHCVEIDERDARLLSAHQTGLAHCPRSNARLRNGSAPMSTYLENDLAFGFGTDSLASCDDLSPLAEARFAIALHRANHPEMSFGARQAVEHLTLKAAKCLRMDGEIGSLTSNKQADIVVFEVGHALSAREIAPQHDPFDLLIYGDCQLIASFVNGQEIFNRAESAPEESLVSGR